MASGNNKGPVAGIISTITSIFIVMVIAAYVLSGAAGDAATAGNGFGSAVAGFFTWMWQFAQAAAEQIPRPQS